MMTSSRAIIRIKASSAHERVNYSRRMYAVIRRYTPEVVEGEKNECYAELTGLRTFFKMSYAEMIAKIVKDLRIEIGVAVSVKVASVSSFEQALRLSKRVHNISTYKEMNTLFKGRSLNGSGKKTLHPTSKRRLRFSVPYLGKVS